MGIFGDDDSSDATTDAINNQISQNEQELEEKRKNLFETRINIIKSDANLGWTPDNPNTDKQATGVQPKWYNPR